MNELTLIDIPMYRVIAAMHIVADYNLQQAVGEVKQLLDTDNEILLCEVVSTLKQLGQTSDIDKDSILNKMQDENKKALVQSLLC